MSVRMMAQVWELRLPDSQKLVLLALADCANDEGHAWPSVATLCRKTTRSERTVQGVLIELENAGHIERQQIPGKGCNYTIHPRKDCAPADDAPRQGLRPRSEQQGTPAAAADKPSRTINTPKRSARDTLVPADFWPVVKPDSITGKAMAAWPPGELEEQVEHFIDRHTATGTVSKCWQASWRTWVKNWKKFNGKRPANDHRPHRRSDEIDDACLALGFGGGPLERDLRQATVVEHQC
jgi:hypothetical protein